MQVTAMFLHNMRTAPCPAWICDGDNWTDELKLKANALMGKYMEFAQFPSFNYWQLITDGSDWVVAKRFTWEDSWIGGTWEKLESALEKYYQTK